MLKVLYVYRTRRKPILKAWQRGLEPESKLFGLNYLRRMGYRVDFFDYSYSLVNPIHWLFYPLEHAIINQTGMGFKLDQAVSLLPLVKNYDVIVATADVAGLPFLWLKHLGLLKKPVIVLGGATAGTLKDNWRSWVRPFYQKIYQAVDILTCYAKEEVGFFVKKMKLPVEKVRYIPYCTDWRFFSKTSGQKRTIVVAAGTDESRDYATFLAAVKDLPVKVELACRPDNVAGLSIPQNVRIEYKTYVEMRNMFQRAAVVVVPLKEIGRSAGQMVALEAAAAGCALVVSEVIGMTTAYEFKHEKHLLYVPPGDVVKMQQAIELLLKQPKWGKQLGLVASKLVKQNYAAENMAKNVAGMIEDVA